MGRFIRGVGWSINNGSAKVDVKSRCQKYMQFTHFIIEFIINNIIFYYIILLTLCQTYEEKLKEKLKEKYTQSTKQKENLL
jgi:large-conductance mechanosensitive channel